MFCLQSNKLGCWQNIQDSWVRGKGLMCALVPLSSSPRRMILRQVQGDAARMRVITTEKLQSLSLCVLDLAPKVNRYTCSFELDMGIKLYTSQMSLNSLESCEICWTFDEGMENRGFDLWQIRVVFRGIKKNLPYLCLSTWHLTDSSFVMGRIRNLTVNMDKNNRVYSQNIYLTIVRNKWDIFL